MSEVPSAEKDAGSIAALIDKYERLAATETARYCRAQDVVLDLDALRDRVATVVARMRSRQVDHRHPNEIGAGTPYGLDGRAYFYAGDIYDDFADLSDALGEPRVTPPGVGA